MGQLEAPAWALLSRAAGEGMVGAPWPGLWKPPTTEGLLGILAGPRHQLLAPFPQVPPSMLWLLLGLG